MNPVSMRLLSQQLASPQFKEPAAVVSWFGAMQGQEYKMMRWAVSMRTKKPSYKAFEKAFNAGEIVRTHLFRTTWQLIAGEDLGWMLDVCRNKARAGLRGWMHSNGVDISAKEEARISGIFAEAATGRRSVLKEEFAEALRERDIDMDEQHLSYHLRLAELSGLLCSGDLHPTKRTLALVSEKVKHPLHLDRDEALALLARKYYRSHGPATLEDFVWWSGLNVNDCRRAMSILGDELVPLRLQGRAGRRMAPLDDQLIPTRSQSRVGRLDDGVFYVHKDARMRGCRSGGVLLIPAFDEYLIGYKSRYVVLPPEQAHRAHNQSGIFYHVVALDGRIVGNWSPTARDGGIDLFNWSPTARDGGIDLFQEGLALPADALARQLAAYRTFAAPGR